VQKSTESFEKYVLHPNEAANECGYGRTPSMITYGIII
jgi:hypothetical protein